MSKYQLAMMQRMTTDEKTKYFLDAISSSQREMFFDVLRSYWRIFSSVNPDELASQGMGCPGCGERRMDKLIAGEDRVTCCICNREYDIE